MLAYNCLFLSFDRSFIRAVRCGCVLQWHRQPTVSILFDVRRCEDYGEYMFFLFSREAPIYWSFVKKSPFSAWWTPPGWSSLLVIRVLRIRLCWIHHIVILCGSLCSGWARLELSRSEGQLRQGFICKKNCAQEPFLFRTSFQSPSTVFWMLLNWSEYIITCYETNVVHWRTLNLLYMCRLCFLCTVSFVYRLQAFIQLEMIYILSIVFLSCIQYLFLQTIKSNLYFSNSGLIQDTLVILNQYQKWGDCCGQKFEVWNHDWGLSAVVYGSGTTQDHIVGGW